MQFYKKFLVLKYFQKVSFSYGNSVSAEFSQYNQKLIINFEGSYERYPNNLINILLLPLRLFVLFLKLSHPLLFQGLNFS